MHHILYHIFLHLFGFVGAFVFCAFAQAASQSTQTTKPTILFLGDSLTAGYGLTQQEAYPALVQQQLAKQGLAVDIINAGISGSTSASAFGRLRWYLQAKPDIVFLALGANDGLRGLSTEEMYNNLGKTIALAQQNDMKVVLVGMHVPPNYGDDYARAFHQAFVRLSKRDGVVFIPFLLEGVAGETHLNLADGIHPNAVGQAHVAKHIMPTVIRVLREQSQ